MEVAGIIFIGLVIAGAWLAAAPTEKGRIAGYFQERGGRTVAAVAAGGALGLLALLSVVNSFLCHMTPDVSVYLLHARTYLETLNRFTFSWENKGILLTWLLAPGVALFGPTVAAAAAMQLCAYVAAFFALYGVLRFTMSRARAALLVLVAACLVYSSLLWGAKGRPEDFGVACLAVSLYAAWRAEGRWWIVGGAMVACALFLKITLVLAPAAVMLTAVVAQGAQPGRRSGAGLAGPGLRAAAGFLIVAALVIGWIALFDNLAQCYRQTVEWPLQYRGDMAWRPAALLDAARLLRTCKLDYLLAGAILGSAYGWTAGLRREALIVAVAMAAEVLRMSAEHMPFPYLALGLVAPMLVAVSFFGAGRRAAGCPEGTRLGGSAVSWLLPLYLSLALLLPTAAAQAKVFDLRGLRRLPSPNEFLARAMRAHYHPGERIFVLFNSQEILLRLKAPASAPPLHLHFAFLSPEEQRQALQRRAQSPPDWIVVRDPPDTTVRFTLLGEIDDPYFIYVPAPHPAAPAPERRRGAELTPELPAPRMYRLEVDTGYLQAWHLE